MYTSHLLTIAKTHPPLHQCLTKLLTRLAMTSKSSDFVLDEGLDDDEDMLAFHTQRAVEPKPEPSHTTENATDNASASQAEDSEITPAPDAQPDKQLETNSIIIDGLPLTASRADLNSFLPSPESISHIRLRRLESHGLLRVMVEFESFESASQALLLDGSDFQGSALSIKPGTPERWAATAPRRAQPQEAQGSFWGSLSAMAERFEAGARKLGEQLEEKLHVSERVAGTAAAIKEVNDTYGVSEKVGEIARAGKETAKGVDRTYGISDSVGRVVDNVGSAAKVVAKEVDENFRVGDRAREAANVVMKNETLGPVARGLVDSGSGSRKNYQPRGDPPEEEQANGAPEAGSITEDGRVVEGGNRVEVGE